MKFLIFSDIHGCADSASFIVEKDCMLKPDKILLLGDILYHGPRNDVPMHYNPQYVIKELSRVADKIICVRGNCEAEVDQMVLPFPVMSEQAMIFADGASIFMTHGHIYNPEKRPETGYTHFFYGHTHLNCLKKKDGIVFLNPGSISIPKQGQDRSFAYWDDGTISIFSINGNIISEMKA